MIYQQENMTIKLVILSQTILYTKFNNKQMESAVIYFTIIVLHSQTQLGWLGEHSSPPRSLKEYNRLNVLI